MKDERGKGAAGFGKLELEPTLELAPSAFPVGFNFKGVVRGRGWTGAMGRFRVIR
jgi:hypothetical protein